MSFLHPLGLLGLIAIPVIVAIYIIQSKYTEQTVPSTFIWTLSDKFLKKRNPLSGITGIISLILQILTVAVISLAIARPVFVLPGAAKEYCFVLDSSSSMLTTDGKETRFDIAKDEIIDVINDSKNGSTYSLISVSDEAVTVFESVKSKKSAKEYVESLTADHTAMKKADALAAAQEVFDRSPGALIYLISDRGYATHDNIEVIDVGNESAENYAILDASYSHSGGKLKVKAKVISYTSDEELKIKLYIGDIEVSETSVSVTKGEEADFDTEVPCTTFGSFRLSIDNTDSYSLDNERIFYNLESDKSYSVLIVSESGFFLKAAIDSHVNSTIDIISPEEYASVTGDYGLYVFDNYEPEELPDGSVWLINTDRSIKGAGFAVRGKAELAEDTAIKKSNSTSSSVKKLLSGIGDSEIYVKNYVKYSGMYLDFNTLYTIDSHPVIFAGANELGCRQVVFGFDIHESDIALSTDFVILIGNLLGYSFPDVVDKTDYTVGDEITVNLVAGSKNLKAVSPSGKDIYLESDGASASLSLSEIGTYKISLTLSGGEVSYYVYSGANTEESTPSLDGDDFSLSGERVDIGTDGEFDPLMLLFVCLALLFIADWGVYCYEKYQLR